MTHCSLFHVHAAVMNSW